MVDLSDKQQQSIKEARYFFQQLKDKGTHIPIQLRSMERKLQEAAVGFDALDPTGEKTAEQMKRVVEERVKQTYIEQAREHLYNGEEGLALSRRFAAIKECLDNAGVGFEALDKHGKKNAAEMQEEVKRFIDERYIKDAYDSWQELRSGKDRDLDRIIKSIKYNLKEAGAGFEALDLTRRKTAKEMQQEVEAYSKENQKPRGGISDTTLAEAESSRTPQNVGSVQSKG